MVKKIFDIDSVLKTNPWTDKIEDLKGQKILRSFYEKELLLSKSSMSYYTEPGSHIKSHGNIRLDKLCY